MPRKPKPLTRKGDRKQKTKEGLEIPVPKRADVLDALQKGARREDREPSRSDREQR